MKDDQTSAGAAWIHTAHTSCSENRKNISSRLFDALRVETIKCPLTVILVVGDVPWGMGGDDDGQHDKAEHKHEDDQVEHDQEAQEGEVRQDPCAEHPCWMQRGGEVNFVATTTTGALPVRADLLTSAIK